MNFINLFKNNNMKKLIVLGITLLGLIGVSNAQEQSIEEKVTKKVQVLTEQLSLDNTQQDAISTLLQEMFTAKQDIESNEELSQDEKANLKRELYSKTQAQIAEQLNEDQKVLFKNKTEQKDRVNKQNTEQNQIQKMEEEVEKTEEL